MKTAGQPLLTASMAVDRDAIAWEHSLVCGLATYNQNAKPRLNYNVLTDDVTEKDGAGGG